ncbi:MAG: ATP-grasp domain-containing protein [Pirellulales bacterium]|nr:ATP-grasp domain-containing protein [Pirellulales bacterium]
MRIAVVWNSDHSQVLNWLGQPCPEKYGAKAVQNVVEGLRAGGHEVVSLEGDVALLENLRNFFGMDGVSWPAAECMVFNMVYGIQGECRYTHIPAMLEMAGVPYTGSSPLGHALALDKIVTKVLIDSAGLPTPRWMVASRPGQKPEGLRFPLMVKPRHESTSFGLRLVRDRAELDEAVENIVTQFEQDALVEEFIEGREVCVGLLGNDPVETLPLVELCFVDRDLHAFTWEDKMHKRNDEPQRRCPADVPEDLAKRLREISVGTFRACHCKDYSRVDIRIDATGEPYILEINSMASLGERASYVMAAAQAGYSFSSLACQIVDVAHQRYVGGRSVSAAARRADRGRAFCQQSTESVASQPQPSESSRLREEFAA